MRRLSTTALAALALAGCAVFHTPDPAPQLAHPRAPAAEPLDTESIGVTWIGHATVLIRVRDRWILTDPVFSTRIFRIYPRRVAAGIDPRELPHLDAVLVSHSHFDHLDAPSLRRLAGTPVVVPPGTARYVPHEAGTPIVALETWQQWKVGDLTITAVPSSHASGRYGVDFWVDHGHTGYVIEDGDLCVYFAGDTGYDPAQTAEIRRRFDIDVALIPVGPAGRARWIERWRRDVHVTPDAAMTLFAATGAQWMVPIHYGTFFGTIDHDLPIVERAIAASPLARHVRVLGIGQSTEFLY